MLQHVDARTLGELERGQESCSHSMSAALVKIAVLCLSACLSVCLEIRCMSRVLCECRTVKQLSETATLRKMDEMATRGAVHQGRVDIALKDENTKHVHVHVIMSLFFFSYT